MFEVKIGRIRYNQAELAFDVLIEGCPEKGVAAVDFRRQVGLPDAPSNKIELKPFAFTDESFVRELIISADSHADFVVEKLHIPFYECKKNGDVIRAGDHLNMEGWGGKYFVVEPVAIRDYLREQNPDTGKRLILSILGYSQRSKYAAEARAEEIHKAQKELEESKEQARKLLKEELDDLQDVVRHLKEENNYLKEEVESLKSSLKEYEEEEV